MTTGLVIGKFLPPHRGHKYLIDTACAAVDTVDVIVCQRNDDPIAAELRACWLREIHPDVNVHLTVDDIPDGDPHRTSEAWARRAEAVLGYRPDLVFTSEEYGERFANYLGATHVSVDPDRTAHPVSGTLVRADASAHWHQLEACVRAALVRRVCVLGAESTGTSTLARALAEHYGTICVPEYGREFCEERLRSRVPIDWRTEHFVEIAREQQVLEDRAARDCGAVLICDTDALATSVWHERYLDEPSPVVEALAAARTYALYVLTSDDIPFVQDGTRDGEHVRGRMTQRFREVLATRSEPWIEVTGSHEDRLRAAVAAIDEICCPTRRPPRSESGAV